MAIRIGKYLYPGFMLVGGQGNSGISPIPELELQVNETFDQFRMNSPNAQNFTIDWGDGNVEPFVGTGSSEFYSHTYADAGTYTINVYDAHATETDTDPMEYLISLGGTSSFLTACGVGHAGAITSYDIGGFSNLSSFALVQAGSLAQFTGTTNITNVTDINCQNNSIDTIDTSTWVNLATVYISETPLTAFDTTNNTAITDLAIISTGLATINTSGLGNCINLNIDTCNLLSIDLTSLVSAMQVVIANAPIASIGVSPLVSCNELTLRALQITTVDISTNTSLESLSVDGNTLLDTLDITTNTLLTYLNAQGCILDVTEVSNILIALDAAGLSNGEVNLMQSVPAIPDAGGQTAATNLIGKGWTVSIDS